ncbi:UDP-glucose--hexose-1-phosphate uridylyltransferase [Fundicoccus sp. Sow4_D5]|uniref:UDP-glucose--hexose-1-phosphate uridylyltransferase n=1 Tax=Fundicoccus sp. Sow4_D5 TaxID=3438782 RepID=UPI003F8E4E17
MHISNVIIEFVKRVIQFNDQFEEMDHNYLCNQVLALLGEEDFSAVPEEISVLKADTLVLLDAMVDQAVVNQVVEDFQSTREILESRLMDFMTPAPSQVNHKFHELRQQSPERATDYFYELSRRNDYIKTRAIAQNIEFSTETQYGPLEITINLSKPEKNAKQILAESQAKSVKYPQCQLCMENEGYLGKVNYPARSTHRVIRVDLKGDAWGFQYSPYAYFPEHAIFLAEEHRPMSITKQTFANLLYLIEQFPHYFIGSNSDLPISGGSILSHDHYQGGHYDFPMAKAAINYHFPLKQWPSISAGIVNWPMSVIRLQSKEIEDLVEAADFIYEEWKAYSNDALSIRSYTEDGVRHHTLTPIARHNGEAYELDIVLRDNNTSDEFPDGIFHPHPEVQHIKQENIGLIEVMGLAILPPRLKTELAEVKAFLLNNDHQLEEKHLDWAEMIKETHDITEENVDDIIKSEVGHRFATILEHAGVFKHDEIGVEAFRAFVDGLTLK